MTDKEKELQAEAIDYYRKQIAELEKKNKVLAQNLEDTEIINKALEKENAELRKVAEFQQSSNMSRHFENKKLKEGLAVGSTFNKALNSMNKNLEEERDKYRNMVFDKDDQLTKAKDFLKEFVQHYKNKTIYVENMQDLLEQSEQFLRETDIYNAIQKANEGLDLDKIADEVEQDIKEQKVK